MRFLARKRVEPAEPAVSARPRVYCVPAGRPFLTLLAEALTAGHLPVPGGHRPDPLRLADTTLYLPTRRATRALQEAFLKVSGGGALLLPRIKPITEGSEDLDLIASVEDYGTGGAAGSTYGDLRAAEGAMVPGRGDPRTGSVA